MEDYGRILTTALSRFDDLTDQTPRIEGDEASSRVFSVGREVKRGDCGWMDEWMEWMSSEKRTEAKPE